MKDFFVIMLIICGTVFLGAVGIFFGVNQYRANGMVQAINRTAQTAAVVNMDNSVRVSPGALAVSRSQFESAFAKAFPNNTDSKLDNPRYEFDYLFASGVSTASGTKTSYSTGYISAGDISDGSYHSTKTFSDSVPLKAIRVRVKVAINGSDQTFQGTVVANIQGHAQSVSMLSRLNVTAMIASFTARRPLFTADGPLLLRQMFA